MIGGRAVLRIALAWGFAACSDSPSDPGENAAITIEAPGDSVVVGMVEGTGWVAIRGSVAELARIDRLTHAVDDEAERDVEVHQGAEGEGTFDFAVVGLTPGRHAITLRAYGVDGDVRAGPVIIVDAVPTIREIDVPLEAGNAFPSEINERGDVVGYWAEVELPTWHAWMHENGQTRSLTQGDWRSAAAGLNDRGDAVGYVEDAQETPQVAMLWRGTTATPLFAQEGGAVAVNNEGVITGRIFLDAGPPEGFVIRNGRLTLFGEAGRFTIGVDVNGAGDVAGHSSGTFGDAFAFVIAGSQTRTLGSLGGARTLAGAINARGEVTGYSEVTDRTTYRAFREHSGQMRMLRTADLQDVTSYGNDINDLGIIVGEMVTAPDGDHWAFIALDDEMVALEDLLPDVPPLIAAYSISDRGEIAAVAISESGWLRPVIIAVPGGPEAHAASSQSLAARRDRSATHRAIANALEAQRTRTLHRTGPGR